MPTLEIGNPDCEKHGLMRSVNGHKTYSLGFTLIEILLVVLIIGIITVLGANAINSQSPERAIMSSAAKVEAKLKYICDLSVLENRPHGIEWVESGHQILKYQSGDWVIHETVVATGQTPFKPKVLLNGIEQILEPEVEEMPHVICQTDGSFNPFEIRWATTNENDDMPYYSLKSTSPWQLHGAWIEQ
jgi:type II secretion system protein H